MSQSHYHSKVLDHFWNPRNPGQVESPNGIGNAEGGRISMRITLRVEQNHIADVKFQCTTCVVAVASCSLMTELAKGLSLQEALNLTPNQLADQLGEVPEERMDRCVLAIQALHEAIRDYQKFFLKEEIDESRIHFLNDEQPENFEHDDFAST
jgi:nitrogen fixation protein NifU and related proteins